jgi:hypothetical protein
MEDLEYRARYGDPGGEILPLLWLGGCVFCLWVSAGTAIVVTVLAWDLLLGLAVGLGGAVLGLAATTMMAGGFPGVDARWLRLGPLAVAIEFSEMFVGAAIVVLLGLSVLPGQPADVVAPAPPESRTPTVGAKADLFDVLRPVAATLFLLGLVVTVGRGIVARLR